MKSQTILFLCVANSARSQVAEGLARRLAPPGVLVYSAGSAPSRVRGEAIAVMNEIGIDISSHEAKTVAAVPVDEVDLVVSLCAEENCPHILSHAARLHWALPDPAAAPAAERLEAFRRTRDELRRRLPDLWADQS